MREILRGSAEPDIPKQGKGALQPRQPAGDRVAAQGGQEAPVAANIHHGRDAHVRSGNQAHVQSDGEGGHSYYRTFASQPIRNTAMLIGGLFIPFKLDVALTLTEYGLGKAAVYGNQKIDELRRTSSFGGEARGEAAADEIIENQ